MVDHRVYKNLKNTLKHQKKILLILWMKIENSTDLDQFFKKNIAFFFTVKIIINL